jgi:hypothetical protein
MTDLDQLAAESWIFGYPLVLMDVTRRAMTGNGHQPNTFQHLRSFPDHTFTDVVSPNADTLYSAAWLDLRAEPIVLSVPGLDRRYYMMPMLSGWTDVFASPGSRTTGGEPGDFAIVGPSWSGELPAGLIRLDSPTAMAWLIGRTGTAGTKDYLAVHRLQDQYQLTPLSRFEPDAPVGRTVRPLPTSREGSAPVDQVARMDGPTFFGRLAELLGDNPPQAEDIAAVAKLAELGIQARDENWVTAGPNADPAIQAAIAGGPSAGQARLRGVGEQLVRNRVDGWSIPRGLGDYGVDYDRRAYVALIDLGAILDADAVYPHATVDSQGRGLSGGHRYRLHFTPGQLPPVRGFWSLTLYNDKQFFVDNPIDRYAIGDRDDIVFDDDGSLDILVQHDDPGPGWEPNWLPAPTGSFNVFLRTYWPEETILNGTWTPPALVRFD